MWAIIRQNQILVVKGYYHLNDLITSNCVICVMCVYMFCIQINRGWGERGGGGRPRRRPQQQEQFLLQYFDYHCYHFIIVFSIGQLVSCMLSKRKWKFVLLITGI